MHKWIVCTVEGRVLRISVDYRRLNSVAQTNANPMPRVDDIIDELGAVK